MYSIVSLCIGLQVNWENLRALLEAWAEFETEQLEVKVDDQNWMAGKTRVVSLVSFRFYNVDSKTIS